MKKISPKIIGLKLLTSAAYVFLFFATNVTCIGPAYQPKLPKETDKFRIK